MMSAGISVSLVLAFCLFGAINVNLKKLAPVRTFENSFKFYKILRKFGAKLKKDHLRSLRASRLLWRLWHQ